MTGVSVVVSFGKKVFHFFILLARPRPSSLIVLDQDLH